MLLIDLFCFFKSVGNPDHHMAFTCTDGFKVGVREYDPKKSKTCCASGMSNIESYQGFLLRDGSRIKTKDRDCEDGRLTQEMAREHCVVFDLGLYYDGKAKDGTINYLAALLEGQLTSLVFGNKNRNLWPMCTNVNTGDLAGSGR